MVELVWPVTIQCNEELATVSEPAGHIGGDEPQWWRLTCGVLVRCQIAQAATFEVAIPFAYTWDGASIPSLCWRIIGKPMDPRFALASLVHDWICEHAETRPQRVFGDAIFLWLLRDAGVAPWRHYAMFLAVTMYRRLVWRAKR
jgi:hypothetical protein